MRFDSRRGYPTHAVVSYYFLEVSGNIEALLDSFQSFVEEDLTEQWPFPDGRGHAFCLKADALGAYVCGYSSARGHDPKSIDLALSGLHE